MSKGSTEDLELGAVFSGVGALCTSLGATAALAEAAAQTSLRGLVWGIGCLMITSVLLRHRKRSLEEIDRIRHLDD